MSFQITVLKVLAGHPEGAVSLAEIKHAVAILISSGPDWTNRTKALAARTPDLDIFSQLFVLRDSTGWQITEAGRAFLAAAETPKSSSMPVEEKPQTIPDPTSLPGQSPLPRLRSERRKSRRRVRHSVAA